MATDDELAEQIVKLPDSGREPSWSRAHREYSAEVEMLTALFDRLGELVFVTAAVRGGRGRPPKPGPRPAAAVEAVRQRVRRTSHDALVARLIKKKPAEK